MMLLQISIWKRRDEGSVTYHGKTGKRERARVEVEEIRRLKVRV